MTARVRLGGQEYMFLNGGPHYRLNEAFSFFVPCETQAEVDAYWVQLTAGGGEPGQCGWLKDRFGVSWQVIPSTLTRMLSDKDPARAGRVAQVMMTMGKLDIAALQAAYDGSAR
jgi:two-component system sensor histidine kinase QseC